MDLTLPNLTTFLADFTGVPADTIDISDTLAHLGVDSLDLAQLIIETEEMFEVTLPEDAEAIRTVGGLLDAIIRADGVTLG